jgi:hypothetical protein
MKLNGKLLLSALGLTGLISGSVLVFSLTSVHAQAALPPINSSCLCDKGVDLGANNQVFSCQCGQMNCVVATRLATNSPASPQLSCR